MLIQNADEMSPVFSFRQDIDPSQLFEAQIQTFSFA
jgi:hypothetical protein